jgi:hypothetical protein
LGFGVLEVAGGVPGVRCCCVDVAVDKSSVRIVLGSSGECLEGGELGVFGTDIVADEATPEEMPSAFVSRLIRVIYCLPELALFEGS